MTGPFGPGYLFIRCQRVLLSIFLCFFLRIFLRRFLITELIRERTSSKNFPDFQTGPNYNMWEAL